MRKRGDRVTLPGGRTGVLVRRNRPYRQWLVRLDAGGTTWAWESTFLRRASKFLD